MHYKKHKTYFTKLMLKPILSHLHLCELHNNSFILCLYVHVLPGMLDLATERGKSDHKKL